jgi:hypothetical protein
MSTTTAMRCVAMKSFGISLLNTFYRLSVGASADSEQ